MGLFREFSLIPHFAPVSRTLLRLFAAVSACCGAEAAQNPPAPACVLELFTSQGCSSCPPADALLTAMARRPEVVAVSFSVDYWDYIGWKDTLASPAFGARQKGYSAAHGEQHVYTPQIIVDGLTGVVGSDRKEIDAAIAAARSRDGALTLPIRLSRSDNSLLVEVAGGEGAPADVVALHVTRSRSVHIGRGENAGRSVTYTNVVRAVEKLGSWTGSSASFRLPDPREDGEGYVVLLQKGTLDKPGVILGAAKTPGL